MLEEPLPASNARLTNAHCTFRKFHVFKLRNALPIFTLKRASFDNHLFPSKRKTSTSKLLQTEDIYCSYDLSRAKPARKVDLIPFTSATWLVLPLHVPSS